MAIQRSGHKPWEIVYDNQGGHKKLDTDGFHREDMQGSQADAAIQRRVEDDRERVRPVPGAGAAQGLAFHGSERDGKESVEPPEP